MTSDNKRIILCADDFALSPGVSAGITALANKKRISATSCMTTTPHWEKDAQQLQPLCGTIDVGLHFNLTEGTALSANPCSTTQQIFYSLSTVLMHALTLRINLEALRRELNAQLDAFIDITGHLPDFIDGHQHIHHLPGVRQVLLEVYQQRLSKSGCYIRCVFPFISYNNTLWSKQRIKEWVISLTGAKKMQALLQKNNIPHNSAFAGIYDFTKADHFSDIMTFWLKNVPDGTLIMCHPGYQIEKDQDQLYNSRYKELAWLESPAFSDAARRWKITLSRFSGDKQFIA